ncbi:MAG: hypothetical protein RL264_162 [Bacteroidota bacterium]|jgi:hypothetical protein
MTALLEKLFGIHADIFLQCSDKEQKLYKVSTFGFLLMLTLCAFSFTYLFELLTDSWFSGALIGLIFTFIYFNILRFTFISFAVSDEKIVTLNKVFSAPNNLFRMLLCFVYFFTISVPITTFFFHSETTEQIEEFKKATISKYEGVEKKRIGAFLREFDDSVSIQKKEIALILKSEDTEELKRFKVLLGEQKISKIQQNKQRKILLLNAELKEDIEKFEQTVNNAGLPFKRIMFALEKKSSWVLLSAINLFGMAVLLLFIYVRYGVDFKYGHQQNNIERLMIESEYVRSKREMEGFLRTQFNYNFGLEEKFLDPPFNTIPNNTTKNQLANLEAYDYFKSKN